MVDGRTITVMIDHIGSRGDGVADTPDGPVFVAYTAPGDEVEVSLLPAGQGAFKGEIKRVLVAGPARITPPCAHFGQCGGCSLQHLAATAYSDWINERIETALAHQGIDGIEIKEAVLSPPASRRRLTLKYLRKGVNVWLGYHQRGSHQLVEISACPVARSELVALFEPLKNLIGALHQSNGGNIVLTSSDVGVSAVVDLAEEPDLVTREKLSDFANQYELAALHCVIDGLTEPVAELRPASVDAGGVTMLVPPGAFLQATAEGQEALIAAVTGAARGARTVVDLFSGTGTFALPLAKEAKVHAVEGELRLTEALERSASRAGGLRQLTVEHRDLFRRPLYPDELSEFEAVVFDPPRAGAKSQVAEIAVSPVPVVIGVSCNPNTFARDARTLIDGGYSLCHIQPIDQFLWSHHVELVGVFRR